MIVTLSEVSTLANVTQQTERLNHLAECDNRRSTETGLTEFADPGVCYRELPFVSQAFCLPDLVVVNQTTTRAPNHLMTDFAGRVSLIMTVKHDNSVRSQHSLPEHGPQHKPLTSLQRTWLSLQMRYWREQVRTGHQLQQQ